MQEKGFHETAISHYKKAIQINRRYSIAYKNLGICLHELSKYDEAAANYRKALDIDPGLRDALAGLGQVLMMLGEHREGLDLLREANGSIFFHLEDGISFS